MKAKLNKQFQTEMWTLLGWLNELQPKGVELSCVCAPDEVCLINDKADFMYNFNLSNLKDLQGANKLMCLWVNCGVRKKTDCSGKSLFDFEDFTQVDSG